VLIVRLQLRLPCWLLLFADCLVSVVGYRCWLSVSVVVVGNRCWLSVSVFGVGCRCWLPVSVVGVGCRWNYFNVGAQLCIWTYTFTPFYCICWTRRNPEKNWKRNDQKKDNINFQSLENCGSSPRRIACSEVSWSLLISATVLALSYICLYCYYNYCWTQDRECFDHCRQFPAMFLRRFHGKLWRTVKVVNASALNSPDFYTSDALLMLILLTTKKGLILIVSASATSNFSIPY